MDYGSILGMGSYFSIDFTTYTLRIYEDTTAHYLGFDAVPPQDNASAMAIIRQYLMPIKVDPTPKGNYIVVSNEFAQGFYNAVKYYSWALNTFRTLQSLLRVLRLKPRYSNAPPGLIKQ